MSGKEILRGGTGLTLYAEMQDVVWDMRWLILLVVVLILADLRFGIKAAKVEGNKIRRSRAIRRTLNKFADYICWLILAGFLGQAIGVPMGVDRLVVATVVMLLACGSEIDSIVQNYCEARGLPVFSLRRFCLKLVMKKSKDVGEALEETLKEEEKGK